MRGSCEALHLVVCKRCCDEQDGVGVVGARFDNLVLIDGEVFAQAGQRDGR